jgi:type VI secretion system secreted protein VgrG
MTSEAGHQRAEGAPAVRSLSDGRRFKPYDGANSTSIVKEQVTVEIIPAANDRFYAANEAGEPEYQDSFISIPSKVPASPQRTTKCPKIKGPKLALAARPEGEEIHPDEHGCIKVWCHFRPPGRLKHLQICSASPNGRPADEDGRLGQLLNPRGAELGRVRPGCQIIPRIGLELMVTHLDGDPARRLLTRVVPNANNQSPAACMETQPNATVVQIADSAMKARTRAHCGESRPFQGGR